MGEMFVDAFMAEGLEPIGLKLNMGLTGATGRCAAAMVELEYCGIGGLMGVMGTLNTSSGRGVLL